MNECDQELQQKIDEHRKDGVITCGPECWCWSAQGTVLLYYSAIEANKGLVERDKGSCKHDADCMFFEPQGGSEK